MQVAGKGDFLNPSPFPGFSRPQNRDERQLPLSEPQIIADYPDDAD